jgi:hypothetical protein
MYLVSAGTDSEIGIIIERELGSPVCLSQLILVVSLVSESLVSDLLAVTNIKS